MVYNDTARGWRRRRDRDRWASSPAPSVPMFMGAMIMGPLGGWSMKHIDAIWDGKIKPGFEMLVNNFSAGIWGFILAIVRLLRR